jgi:hypothetical protein
VLWILDNGLIYTYIHFFCKYIHIIHRNTQTQYKQTCFCTQMFALCGNRNRDLLRSRRVFPPLRHIGRQTLFTFILEWKTLKNEDLQILNGWYICKAKNIRMVSVGKILYIVNCTNYIRLRQKVLYGKSIEYKMNLF